MTEDIHLIAFFKVEEKHLESFMPMLQALAEGSRMEPGNRRYEITQDMDDPCAFVVIERWASLQAIEEHVATPHYQAYVQFAEGKIIQRFLHKLQQVF